MADTFNIYRKCMACGGTGEIQINDEEYDPGPATTTTCPTCGGDGEIFWGVMREEEEE